MLRLRSTYNGIKVNFLTESGRLVGLIAVIKKFWYFYILYKYDGFIKLAGLQHIEHQFFVVLDGQLTLFI